MNELIKQIKALKFIEPAPGSLNYYNNAINDVLEILQSKTIIQAKALRKEGTDLFYYYDGNDWCEDKLPIPFDGDYDEQIDLGLSPDAKLIDIEIII